MLKDGIEYADDNKKTLKALLRLRIPSLLVGLVLGIILSFATSKFEKVLASNISVAYFIPFVVYMADAVGTQTQNIYSRNLKSGKAIFKKYFFKESALGLIIGLIFGIVVFPIVLFWFHSTILALAVSVSTFVSIASAPLIALITTEILELEHKDPAVGAGPIATVIQDTVSILIYGFIATAILL